MSLISEILPDKVDNDDYNVKVMVSGPIRGTDPIEIYFTVEYHSSDSVDLVQKKRLNAKISILNNGRDHNLLLNSLISFLFKPKQPSNQGRTQAHIHP